MQASRVASRQKLVVGPWPHWVNRKRRLTGVDFGENAIIELDDYVLRFLDHHLKGMPNGIDTLRARFWESLEAPKLLTPEKPTLFEISMDACGVRFLAGHRIRLELASSWFTQYDRNTNSGAENFFKDRTIVIATQRIHHEQHLPSCVVLPVVRRSLTSVGGAS